MLNALVNFSLRFRSIVVILACMLVGYGLVVAYSAKLDVFPEFVPPQVAVQTEAPGLTPDQVETLVTRPVESAINGLGNLTALRSESIQGLSIVTAVFEDGTDIFRARQNLSERLLEAAGELPQGVKAPRMEPMTSSTMDLLKIGLTSDKKSGMELRTFADWVLKPRLLSVPGVAKCSTFGGQVRQLQIQVIPAKLVEYNISVNDIINAARAAVGVRGAGFIDTGNQRINLQSVSPALTPAQLGELLVDTPGGQSVRLKNVAHIVEDGMPPVGDSIIDGEPGVLLTMSSQYGANTMEVTIALEKALADMQPLFDAEEIELHGGLHRPATFISASLHNIAHSLVIGGILVAVVLFIFLFNIRTAIISLTAIPLSLLTAVIVMDKLGFTLNTITLGGLAIAIGEVVDDAIIDIENIYRRLRENQLSPNPRPLFNVVLDASLEVRSAVVYATFVVILVFVPVLTMSGLQGKFFAPLGWAYIIAILASLGVALTVTPALAMLFFKKGVQKAHDPWIQHALKVAYQRILAPITRHSAALITIVAAICVLVIGTLFFFGEELLPPFKEGHFVVGITTAPGMSLTEMRRLGINMSEAFKKIPHIRTVEMQIGRSELGEDTWGPDRGEFHINLDDNINAAEQDKVEAALHDLLDQNVNGAPNPHAFPGVTAEITTFLGDRIGESISGEHADVVINIFGEDLDKLDAVASDVADALAKVKGATEVSVKAPPGGSRLVIQLRPDRLLQFGYKPADVLDAVQIAYEGQVVGQSYEGDSVSDVSVILDPASRSYPEQVKNLLVDNGNGTRHPLYSLANIYEDVGRSTIRHDGARRLQTVTCNLSGVDPATFESTARAALGKLDIPEGMYLDFGGEAESARAARNQLILYSSIAAVGILMLLAIVFGNVRNLLLLLVNLPFALVGGILAVILTSHDITSPVLSIGAMVGFVTIFGITTRNSIMLLSHFEHLVKFEGMTWNLDAALRGASERLVPILMTALVTALGLLPLALGSGEAGREIEGPMAIVILGGLFTSTLLNLLVMPALALKFARFTK
ncbi:MAG TPA: efflux RND transporter permease subunit [Phycisphaerae bacterium]|nr:efflux RND transporter permease subunit [Phycisphaerae bacterium]